MPRERPKRQRLSQRPERQPDGAAHELSEDSDFEAIRRAWAAFSRVDEDGFRREVQPDIVAVPFGAVMEGESYRGVEEVVGWWRHEILSSWEWFEVIAEEFRRVGDRILVTGQWNARGRGSGVELRMRATWVIEVRDGKVGYWQTYTDQAQALRHVGLEGT
jgi:ketosteroid isomerase-like protein